MAEKMRQVELGPVEAIPPGEGRTFVVGKEAVAVFRTRAGRLFATQAFCPHARGPLADGMIGGTAVLCPLHSFAFDLESGRCLSGGAAALRPYAVSATPDGQIRLEVPAQGRPGPLRGRKVALLEARLASEAASLVRRLGGEPVSVPALREEPVVAAGPAVSAFLDRLVRREVEYVILQTGVGMSTLAREAERLGRTGDLVRGLERAHVVCRGPKPSAALAALGLRPDSHTASPHTTAEILACLEHLPLERAGVGVVHYGERNEEVAAALRKRKARLAELLLYEWCLPEDTAPLQRLAQGILDGNVDAVAFTTQVQVRHLFAVTDFRLRPALAEALERRVVTGAVGPTCAAALHSRGVQDVVVPQNPKLGPLFAALASRLAAPRSRAAGASEVGPS